MRWWTFLESHWAARWRFRRLRGAALLRFQDERIRAVVAHARRRSPFFRSLYADWDGRDWRTLPTIDKAAMMANFDAFTTLGVRKDDVMPLALAAERGGDPPPTWRGHTFGLSSGTSGHRGLFVIDERERMIWAGTILARMLPGLPPRGYRVALFLRANNRLYDGVRGRWIRLRFWDLMTPLDELVPSLRDFDPHVVIAPPSLLVELGRRQRDLRIEPRQVFSVAETLEPQDEELLRAAFDVPVGQVYQCTEGLLAVSCPLGSLHVQEDVVAVQFDELGDRRATPIVTDLWRRVQPIVRYRLNDVVTLSATPCRCGSAFRVIERIEGRCDDACELETNDGGRLSVYPDVVRRMILLADERIEDYRVVQDRTGAFRLHLRIAVGADWSEVTQSICASAASIAARYGCRPPKLTFAADIPPDEGKRRRVRRTITPGSRESDAHARR